jgi:nitrate/TMAO reductase-like tetraheme cytochrome c subunit
MDADGTRDAPEPVDGAAGPEPGGAAVDPDPDLTQGRGGLVDDMILAATAVGGEDGAPGEAPSPGTEAPSSDTSAASATVGGDAGQPSSGRGPRWKGLARLRAAIHVPRSRRGIFALLLLGGALGAVVVFSGVTMIQWTETADFCGRCHAMDPELVGYELGSHSEVACAECHVEPGIAGWVKAKINGTRQLAEVILGSFPEPVPPPDHDMLPSVQDTCLRCHEVGKLAPANLRTRTSYLEDATNTPQFVGLMIRPGGGDPTNVERSTHWHILQEVDYIAEDQNAQTIDWVAVHRDDGQVDEYVAAAKVSDYTDAQPDIDAIKAEGKPRTMDCISCHNRVGHPLPNPRIQMDTRMTADLIDPALPYIKREGMRLLYQGYPSFEVADQDIKQQLDTFYRVNYPSVYENDAAQISQSTDQIQQIYHLTSSPEMRVTAATYPSNIGHTDFVGCFRCHDGGHYLVKDGQLTNTTIPSTCDTCHTWPQLGAVASVPLGQPPATHNDDLWVFDHKTVATSKDPGGTTCGDCHAKDYCDNCHVSGAINVDHDQMLTNHAEAIRMAPNGSASCAYCHQEAFCATCHSQDMLPDTRPGENSATPPTSHVGAPTSSSPSTGLSPDGLTWPLVVGANAALTGATAASGTVAGP